MPLYVQGSIAQPAAGADLSYLPDFTDAFRLLTLRVQLTTAVAAANRYPHFQFVTASGEVMHEVVAAAAQVASTTITYLLVGAGGSSTNGGVLTDNTSGLALPDIWWPAGTRLRTATTAIQAADQWSSSFFTLHVGREHEHLQYLMEIAENTAE